MVKYVAFNAFQIRLTQNIQIVIQCIQSVGSHTDLTGTFFACYVQYFVFFGNIGANAQIKARFTYPGVADHEYE